MAGKVRYPQIPATVWWGVRSILTKNPRVKVDEKLLGAQLGVQATAAKQYVNELKAVGILDEDCRATDLANKWRLDETYPSAAREIVESNYPEALLHLSPPDDPNRESVVNWFMHEGFGHGAALNKAAAYLLLGATEPDGASVRNGKKEPSAKRAVATVRGKKSAPVKKQSAPSQDVGIRASRVDSNRGAGALMPLNVNVQIHISADASSEQIESIFASMKRYLYESDEVD